MIFLILLWIFITYISIEDGEIAIFFAGNFGGSIIVVLLLFLASMFFHTTKSTVEYKTVKYEIASLDDTENFKGSFLLGTGSMGSNQTFTFYRKTNDGGYKRDYVYASKTTIYEDENNKPYIQINKSGRKHYKSKWVFWVLLFNHYNAEVNYKHTKSIEFHVPENTIIKEINLDNK